MASSSGTRGLKAVLYLRVSTDQQTVENQRPELLQLAEARGFEIVEIIEETASAAKQRAGLDRVMKLAHQGKCQVVVTWALDRLGRSMIGNLQTVLELDKLGVQVVSMREPWLQMDSPVRSLLIAVFSWVAEEERNRIRARSKLGVERSRREGKRQGRPPAQVDLDQALLLKRRGLSLRAAAKKLGIGSSTLHRIYRAQAAETRCERSVPKV